MRKDLFRELPIRSKIEMAKEVGQILSCLHRGEKVAANALLQDLKLRSVYLDEAIQQGVLVFAEQVQFQASYDPWHTVTGEVERAADQLIEQLGFMPPPLNDTF